MQVPLIDGPAHDLLSILPPAIQFVEEARLKGGRALVYCTNGLSRSVAVLLAYMVSTRKYSLSSAYRTLQTSGQRSPRTCASSHSWLSTRRWCTRPSSTRGGERDRQTCSRAAAAAAAALQKKTQNSPESRGQHLQDVRPLC